MNCPKCDSILRIGKTSYSFENDDTPNAETIAYVNMPMLCVNAKCDNYSGSETANPNKVVQTIRNRMN